jgi:ATP-binding cassette subfamily B protein
MFPAEVQAMVSFMRDGSITGQRLKRGTVRRMLSYARPYRLEISIYLAMTVLSAGMLTAIPVLLQVIIDHGILRRDTAVVLWTAGVVAGLAVMNALLAVGQRWYSARVGEGFIYDLRTEVFSHVQRQPLAFFTRAQTGSLVSRLNSDVISAQQALTSTLSGVVSNTAGLVLALAAMLWLSWPVTVVALVLIPLFIIPARPAGRRLQRLTRESMQLDAEMGAAMTERFNVAGAMLVKLFGDPASESRMFAQRAARVRDIGVTTAMYGTALYTGMTLLASLAMAVVYGLGGWLVIRGTFQLGALVALAALLGRLYGPVTALANVQADVMTALVSFDRVFEVLDLKPAITERPGALPLPRNASGAEPAPEVSFDRVSFRYPAAGEVSLASLESISLPGPERAAGGQYVLHDMSFTAPAGRLTALVGPSGAGKTTITHLVARLYDPGKGTVRIGGADVRDITLASLSDTVGVVTQDAHLFHDTIRANLAYARPGATEEDLTGACRAAQIQDLIAALPDGMDTVVGDRGYRLSGGEKQRVVIARPAHGLVAPLIERRKLKAPRSPVASKDGRLRTAVTGNPGRADRPQQAPVQPWRVCIALEMTCVHRIAPAAMASTTRSAVMTTAWVV